MIELFMVVCILLLIGCGYIAIRGFIDKKDDDYDNLSDGT